ncbi:MAG: hypothetical protein M1817_006231 [Caeruleum heppii]|nr:MAG: hypothetical protein M1817_006231 [Caeruleum heppii]
MSRFFPHTPYAEDQPLSRTLLTTHVLHRGFQVGTTLGLLAGGTRTLILPLVRSSHPRLSTALVRALVERSAGVGALAGTAAVMVMLPMKMWDQTEIQWQDRAWRLRENEGQMEVDDWSLTGTAAGALLVGWKTMRGEAGRWKRIVGGAGMGNMTGVLGYLTWRYAIRGGKREETVI